MQPDLSLAVLAILLGAMIAYAVDEYLHILPRVGKWLGRLMEQ